MSGLAAVWARPHGALARHLPGHDRGRPEPALEAVSEPMYTDVVYPGPDTLPG